MVDKEKQMLDGINDLTKQMGELTAYVKYKLEIDFGHLDSRVSKIERHIIWIVTLILGGVITAIMSKVMV